MSPNKDYIERMLQKFTFIKMSSCPETVAQINHLGFCLKKIYSGGAYVPFRDQKLTHFLEDSLTSRSKFVIVSPISSILSLKSQISILAFTQNIGQYVSVKKVTKIKFTLFPKHK